MFTTEHCAGFCFFSYNYVVILLNYGVFLPYYLWILVIIRNFFVTLHRITGAIRTMWPACLTK